MKTLALLLIGLLISPLAFCDNVFDDIIDIAKGRNEDLPVDLYVAYTTKDSIPLLPANLRIKASTPFGDEFMERGSLSIGLEF